ncbi:MAG: hypothetical protein WCG85_21255 [Polyangia bacterium]
MGEGPGAWAHDSEAAPASSTDINLFPSMNDRQIASPTGLAQ